MTQSNSGSPGSLPDRTPSSSASGLMELLGTLLSPSGPGAADTLSELSRNIGNLVPASQLQAEALLANTQALVQDTSTHGSGGVAQTASQMASTFTGGLLGSLSPILSGVLSLFGGGGSSTPQPLTSYIPPPSLTFQGANVPGAAVPGLDYGQSGLPRAIDNASQSAPQITVNVQAMDSQSFLDHSQDIAQAVRSAILSMHSLNDVITDL
jgi:hypothetical protein